MLFPLNTMGRTKFRPYITFFLILINVIAFLFELPALLGGEQAQITFFGSVALSVCSIQTAPITFTVRNALFTMFLHGDIAHLLFNMFFLWLFAPRVEAYFGHRRFLAFYILVGFLASLAHILFSGVLGICGTPFPFGQDMLVGASGAIAGVMGAFFILYPGVRLRVSFLIFPLVLPAYLYLLVWVGTDIYRLLTTTNSMIAHWAHIGGFFAGMIVVFFATLFVPAPPANPLAHLDDE